ncbi:hypothetical protein B0O99DRAFT_604890 [Bisporella sp. PMI_857]|nr:hypothetical protein B0O99DRAFT_604890 [Bisporella sp. PMI_857]
MAAAGESAPPNVDTDSKNPRLRRKFILCFDGTGNKFQGNAGDSNILKIYSLLERSDKNQFHYYQPGIGTYTNRSSLSSNGLVSRISSWYHKAKDSAIGTTLDEHVMAGYRFLMRYYQDGDDIFLFGFSRGAYIARFLAEMLDHIGLLSAGNEELVRFVWKTFAKWQQRNGQGSEEEKELFRYMKGFRETFARPVRRIRFLGLFDTVNSVSKFEGAWMRRSNRFPYTARSSARTICHAVSIDERRAKFRQDLISQKKERHEGHRHPHLDYFRHYGAAQAAINKANGVPSLKDSMTDKKETLEAPHIEGNRERFRSMSRGRSRPRSSQVQDGEGRMSFMSCRSEKSSTTNPVSVDEDEEDEKAPQKITEVWFPGCHADIGGGWTPDPPENLSLSHAPLVWMIKQAQKAGLVFNGEKLRSLGCHYEEDLLQQDDEKAKDAGNSQGHAAPGTSIPIIEVNNDILPSIPSPVSTLDHNPPLSGSERLENHAFIDRLHKSCTLGPIHDSLQRKQGTPNLGVLTWNIMEFLPFRRMDLCPDGTWKAIWWPLPMGETRDIPVDVQIHNSVIRRMQADENYRPGNLIIGGGGRGKRRAPKEVGIGDWEAVEEGKGHPIDEVWVRAKKEG